MSDVTKTAQSCIRDLSTAQGGFVTRAQLRSAGLGRGAIVSWLENERLQRAWPSVYAVGHAPSEPRTRAFGAMLAAGQHAALARMSAAAFYGAVRRWPDTYELLSPHRCRVRGVEVRCTQTLLIRDVWRFDGLRVTSPARTALDVAATLDTDRFKSLVDHLRLSHHLSLNGLADVLARNPRHPGAMRLRALIGEAGGRAKRSGLERRWAGFARSFDIPSYEQNVIVAGYEVDVLIDGILIVELDTFWTHLLNFHSDRRRDADILARTGIPTVRFTDDQFMDEPGWVAAQILVIVAALQDTNGNGAHVRRC